MTNNYSPEANSTVTIGDWIITFILSGLPVIGFIMIIVWAFGSDAPQSKKNWAKAQLVIMLIGLVLTIIFITIIAATIGMSGLLDNLGLEY
jgi:uncharacterized membrane-anchored protein